VEELRLKNKPGKPSQAKPSQAHALLVSCLAYSSTLKVEVACSSKALVGFQ
jgi:hypothetical protein